ncbi:MAG: KUP/HAK/KT family potassium transporter [Acidobacteriaceae bacterium]|nr:KUP/HAK/KT family potassium transporter [Acidobacteriaceae bacterium]MBV9503297.1 KUP/HAK/KT family potassium transporter [Acidobacteriaceae bacterium]
MTTTPVSPVPPTALHSDRPLEGACKHAGALALTVAALGVVFGDIGTSPLYTLQACLTSAGGQHVNAQDIFGMLSLMVWALILVVTIKYLFFILRADHHGEGGIFALLAIVPESFRSRARHTGRVTGIALLGVIGAALLYGDGVITPAISVLSAVEGLTLASAAFKPWIVPLTCVILIALFTIQRRGTGNVGRLFGPIMAVWFATLAVLGIWHILESPEVLQSILPTYAIDFFAHHGWHGFLILGSVVLVVTGGEALYADLGHFGRAPIRRAWLWLVFPALVIGYLGQGALVLSHPKAADNPFFAQVPAGVATIGLVILSSAATVIASQALISGAFSLTRQAMVLGYFPNVTVQHTSEQTEGQIYIPEVNALLAIGCVLLVLTFRESVKLAAAYGIAVTGTMAITSVLFFFVTHYVWKWATWKSVALLVFFLSFDIPFLGANVFKFFQGGYVPVLIGASLIAAMLIWNRGRTYLAEQYATKFPTFDLVRDEIRHCLAHRVPGTAVFVAPSPDHIPPILVHFVERCRSLHENVILLTVRTEVIPKVPLNDSYKLIDLGDGFWRLTLHFGYMERPLIVDALQRVVKTEGLPIDLQEMTYYVGHETLKTAKSGYMGRIAEAVFAYLQRNAVEVESTFGLPVRQVVEIGTQIDL